MAGLRLLAIHAHPDDESSKAAATMARYVDEGNRVKVLTCTGGERGDILNPAMDRPGVKENIGAIRREEMANAIKALGVEHEWLGYVDSGLPEGDPLPPLPEGSFALADTEEEVHKVVKVIREFRPHVIITYDENGGYPHPDHLKVHEVSMMMTIALRFIPTLVEETDKIMNAQKARGAELDTGRLTDRIKALIPVLIPLFISAFRRADELATAMECRCYHGGEGRTRLKTLQITWQDVLSTCVCICVLALIIATNFFVPKVI